MAASPARSQHIRLLGVLQRIALAYLFAGLIFVFFGLRGRIAWCVGLARRILGCMTFVPVPGGTAGDFAEGKNLANWVDAQLPAAAEMGRRPRSRRPAEHAAGDRQLPVGRFRRHVAPQRHAEAVAEALLLAIAGWLVLVGGWAGLGISNFQ